MSAAQPVAAVPHQPRPPELFLVGIRPLPGAPGLLYSEDLVVAAPSLVSAVSRAQGHVRRLMRTGALCSYHPQPLVGPDASISDRISAAHLALSDLQLQRSRGITQPWHNDTLTVAIALLDAAHDDVAALEAPTARLPVAPWQDPDFLIRALPEGVVR